MATSTHVTSTETERTTVITTRSRRLLAVAVTTLAAAATWTFIEIVLGVDVVGPAFDSGSRGVDVGIGSVVGAAAGAALMGWSLLAILERWTARPGLVWTATAIGTALLSLGGPFSWVRASTVRSG